MSKNDKYIWISAGALVASLGIEWFISGSNYGHSQIRNIFVGGQILLGLIMMLYPYYKKVK